MNTLPVVNPAAGEILAQLPISTGEDVARAFRAAKAAQPGWAALPLQQRIAVVREFRHRLEAERESLARTLTREMGKPITQARAEINGTLGRLDYFLAETPAALAVETVGRDEGSRTTEEISHEPLGVVALISAWNYPFYVGGNAFIPALLAGNAVLYKPSEYATMTGLAIGRLWHASGVPEAVFVTLVGRGDVGSALVAQPVDGVFFTGSSATGSRIAQAVAGRMIRLQLELGGKDPVYVCEDVDIAAAAAATADGAMYNAGQSCCAVERLYVHQAIHDDFVAAFVETVKGFAVGDPEDEKTYLGPLARDAQLAVLEAQVADAVEKGAKLLCGGKRVAGRGNTFAPTVLTGVTHEMKLMREESFGPVIGIMAVGGDDEAVERMNDSEYGLTAGVYTRSGPRAKAILAKVRAGSCYWNCCDRVSPRLPWGGVGASGIGVTLSKYGIQAFTRPRAWHLRQPV